MADVQALEMDVVTEKSNHQVVGMAVSVCLTPAAPAPLPIPYPTVAMVADGISDSPLRTKVSGTNCATIGSVLKSCHGNEAGTLKEVVSLNNTGPVAPITGAFTVLIELGPAAITGSLCDMNKAPTPGAGSSASGAGGAGGGGGGGAGGPGAGGGPSGPSGPAGGGGGGGGSGSGAAGPNTPSAHERNIAAQPGKSPAQIAARKKVAADFIDNKATNPPGKDGKKWDRKKKDYRKHTDAEKQSELKCIDYNKPLRTRPPNNPPDPDGLPPLKNPQTSIQVPPSKGGTNGQYYSDPVAPPGKGPTPSQLGIGSYGSTRDPGTGAINGGTEKSRVPCSSTAPNDQPYMNSTAAPCKDTWSGSGAMSKQDAKGGGSQNYVPNNQQMAPNKDPSTGKPVEQPL